MLMMSVYTTLIAYNSSNPFILCLLLIILALLTGVLSGAMFMKWISYSIILIFLGGMMIIFVYVTSLAGNEKFIFKSNYLTASLFVLMLTNCFFVPLNSQMKKENYMIHLFMSSSSSLLWFLVLFLMSTLIVVVKMAESFKGALIKFF